LHPSSLENMLRCCSPTGLLVIAGLNSANRVLWQQYNPLVRQYVSEVQDLPAALLLRTGIIDPGQQLLRDLRQLRDKWADVRAVRVFCDEIGGRFRYQPGR
jgi:hypothetical protein